MLNFQTSEPPTVESNEEGYNIRINYADGRFFDLGLPTDTTCVFRELTKCAFHRNGISPLPDKSKQDNLLVHNKHMSCVRQLLARGVAPFPYKVAKALNATIYRNIEFDVWLEQFKVMMQLQRSWCVRPDSQTSRAHEYFHEGAKCYVQLSKTRNTLVTCYIQQMYANRGYCIVFVEQFGENRMVPCSSLRPLNPYKFESLKQHMPEYSAVRFSGHYNYRADEHYSQKSANINGLHYARTDIARKDVKQHYTAEATIADKRNGYYNLKEYTHIANFQAHTVEYCTMPFTVDSNLKPNSTFRNRQANRNGRSNAPYNSSAPVGIPDDPTPIGNRNIGLDDVGQSSEKTEQECFTGSAPVLSDCHYINPTSQNGTISQNNCTYGNNESICPPPMTLVRPTYFMCPPPGPQISLNGQTINNPNMQRAPLLPPPHIVFTTDQSEFSNVAITEANEIETHNTLHGQINWNAKQSSDVNGTDLPTDIATLRHFYNLGVEIHKELIKQRIEDLNATNDTAFYQNVQFDEQRNEFDTNTTMNLNSNDGPGFNNVAQHSLDSTRGSAQQPNALSQHEVMKPNNSNDRFSAHSSNRNKNRHRCKIQHDNVPSSTIRKKSSTCNQRDNNYINNQNEQNVAAPATLTAPRNNLDNSSSNYRTDQEISSPHGGYQYANLSCGEVAPVVTQQIPPINYDTNRYAFDSYGGSYNNYGVCQNATGVPMDHTISSPNGQFYLPIPCGIYAPGPPIPLQHSIGMHSGQPLATDPYSLTHSSPITLMENMSLPEAPPLNISEEIREFYPAPPFQFPYAPGPHPLSFGFSATSGGVAAMPNGQVNDGLRSPQLTHSAGLEVINEIGDVAVIQAGFQNHGAMFNPPLPFQRMETSIGIPTMADRSAGVSSTNIRNKENVPRY